jgi:hypothetical protein
MNLTECEIRSVLFMGLMIEWKSGTLQIRTRVIFSDFFININNRTQISVVR